MRAYDDHSGDWEESNTATHAVRFKAIASGLQRFAVDKCVLDVGCGEATLCAWLPPYAKYVGIEVSGAAVRIARERYDSVNILQATAESCDWNDEKFDSIVFNEMLYYARDPVGLLKKYANFLNKDGLILCSVFQHPGPSSLSAQLLHWLDRKRPISNSHCEKMVRAFMEREGWSVLDAREIAIPGHADLCWHIWLARPPNI
jgi:SAM-dependent methyltransferase